MTTNTRGNLALTTNTRGNLALTTNTRGNLALTTHTRANLALTTAHRYWNAKIMARDPVAHARTKHMDVRYTTSFPRK